MTVAPGAAPATVSRLLLLVNPAASGGAARGHVPAVSAELERLGVSHRIVETEGTDHARRQAAAAAEAGERVAALGGDGLLRPIATELRGSASSLAIIPGGRGNDLARVLGIPTEPAAAARIAATGRERVIDMGQVDGVPYLGIASFGFDSDANRIANEAKLVRGNLVYLYAALKALAGWQPAGFTVTVDGERHELSGYSVGVCNSKAYGGGMYAAPQAELDDGLLDVVSCGETTKWDFLTNVLPAVFKGTHIEHPSVTTLRGRTVEVASDRPFDIYADGDPVGAVPATISVDPQSLRVVVPA